MRRHQPRRLVGVDLSGEGGGVLSEAPCDSGAVVQAGAGGGAAVREGEFDVVLNVEAAMNYGSVPRFAGEVHRVLREEGRFLFADQCATGDVGRLREELCWPGFEIVSERDITENVVRALEESSEVTGRIIDARVPRGLRGVVKEMAGVRGSLVYRRFASGKLRYLCLALRRGGG
ncbi:MAG: methyltransferase domain-containing protein [Polyangiaceae bacterium]